jgi:hypothetical protein
LRDIWYRLKNERFNEGKLRSGSIPVKVHCQWCEKVGGKVPVGRFRMRVPVPAAVAKMYAPLPGLWISAHANVKLSFRMFRPVPWFGIRPPNLT